jgi:hypothetical protein
MWYIHSFIYLHTTTAMPRSFNRSHMSCKATLVYSLALYRKSLMTTGLDCLEKEKKGREDWKWRVSQFLLREGRLR